MPCMRARSMGLMVVLAFGCGDDVTPAADGGSSSGSSTQTSTSATDGPSTSSTTGPTSTTQTSQADASSGTGFEPPEPACGNGFVEEGEECDDANDDEEDGCTSSCALRCGIEWTTEVLPPTDTSVIDAQDVATSADGGAVVGGLLREITTDQRGNQTILDDEGVVLRVGPDGETLWNTAIEVDGFDATVTGVAVDDAGNVYAAATVDAIDTDADIRLYKLDPRGAVLWFSEFDSAVDTAEDLSFGVAVGGDGNPVIVGQVRAGEGDNDVWVSSRDARTGDELWSSTWSGEGSGGFSTDTAGPISIASDGTVFVYADEYVDFQNRLPTLLSFDAGGGPATEVYTPEIGVGGAEFTPLDLAVEAGGSLLLTSVRVLPAENTFQLERVDAGSGEVTWSVDAQFFEDASPIKNSTDFNLVGAQPLEGGGVVVTGLLQRSARDAGWVESWVGRLDENDAIDCVFVRENPQLSLIPGSLFGRTISAASSGRAVLAAQEVSADGAQSLWVGAFRPD